MHITLTQDEIRLLLSKCIREGWLTPDCEFCPDISLEDVQIVVAPDNTIYATVKLPESIE